MRGQRNKLWDIEDVDPTGNIGCTVLMARNEAEARDKFNKMHGGFLSITQIEQCLGVSMAMVSDETGATFYQRRMFTCTNPH
jgi:hypothetical protein